MNACTASTSTRAGSSSSSKPSCQLDAAALSASSARARRASASSTSRLADDQRRQQPQRGRPGRVDDEPLLEQRAAHERGRVARRARRRASGRGRAPRARAAGARGPPRSALARARARARAARRRRSRSSAASAAAATTGPPAKVEPWSPGASTSASRSPVTSAPIGRPPPSALAIVIASGTHARLLVGPERAGAAHAGLDLVEDQRRAVLVAGRARRRAAARRRARARRSRPGSARAAPRRCAASTAARERLGSRRDRAEAGHQRRERRLLGLLRRRRQRAVGAPVEGAVDDHDVAAGARLARELDRRLVGLRAGVAEEHLAAEARLRQALGEPHRGLGVEEVADVHQPSPTCSRTAATTRGWQWPRLVTEMPHRKSRYSLPSASHSRAPSPRTNSTGQARVGGRSRSRARAPAARRALIGRRLDLRADAGVGEQLEQQRVRHAPVDDVRGADAARRSPSTQASSFGRMPPSRSGERAPARARRWPGRSGSPGRRGRRSQPGTSVRKITL